MRPSEVAAKYIGRTEKPGNQGFNDAEFEKKMLAVGFHKGDSWCNYFQELVFKEAYPERAAEFDKLFSANCFVTYQNMVAAHKQVSMVPTVDSLVIWQQFNRDKPVNLGTPDKPIYPGHIGVVVHVGEKDQTVFQSIEGNTSSPGVREGYIVARNSHRVSLDSGWLRVKGFVTL